MLVPCEVVVKCVLPPVRAMIAKELTTKYNLKQAEAARLLGVSQPAISLYHRKIRGKAMDLERDSEIVKLVDDLSESLAKGNVTHKEFIALLCEICKKTRAKGLLCEMHKTFDPSIDIKKCNLCQASNALRCV